MRMRRLSIRVCRVYISGADCFGCDDGDYWYTCSFRGVYGGGDYAGKQWFPPGDDGEGGGCGFGVFSCLCFLLLRGFGRKSG